MRIRSRRFYAILPRIEGVVDGLYKILTIVVVIIGGYALYDAWQVELEAISAEKVAEVYMNETDEDVDFDALRSKNSDIIAWLKISDTNINFPVMQGRDNLFYLAHDFERKYATVGGIFLDYRNDADFRDDFSVIYGHRMSNHRMFSDIGEFSDRVYFEKHRKAILYTPKSKYRVNFVAYASVLATQPEIYNIGAYTSNEAVNKIFNEALIKADYEIRGGEKWVLLSTCSTEVLEERNVLLGIMEEK